MYATHGCHKIGGRQPKRRGRQDSRQARPYTLAVALPFLATRATFARSIRVFGRSPHRLYFSPEQPHAVPHETAEQALSGVRPYNNESGSF